MIIDTDTNLIAQWKFRVNECVQYGSGITFGLREETGIWAFVTMYNSGVLYCFGGYEELKKQKVGSNSMKFGEGDIIQFIFDTERVEIKFKKNDEEYIVLLCPISRVRYKVLTSKCRFAVGLRELGNSVTITQSEIVYY